MSGPLGSSQWFTSSDYEITNSLRFNDADVSRLEFAHGTAGSTRTWTHSCWCKRGVLNSYQYLIDASASGAQERLYWANGNTLIYNAYIGSTDEIQIITTPVYRDTSAWYHITLSVDTTQSTEADRIKLYVNGVLQALSTATYPDQNYDTRINSAVAHRISTRYYDNGSPLDGYLAEINFVDGTAYGPEAFGEIGQFGEWKPKDTSGLTFGDEGFKLEFKLATANATNIGKDTSGNGNNWSPTGIVASDQMIDTPTNNFTVLNFNDNNQGALSQGNLRVACNDGKIVKSTFALKKYYYEWRVADNVDGGVGAGIAPQSITESWPGFGSGHSYLSPGIYSTDGTETSGQTSYAVDDIISMTVDTTTATNNIKYYKNNSLVITRGYACDEFFLPAGMDGSSGTAGSMNYNFGADSSFGGLETAQGNTDSNGQGDFYYEPPSGFLAICTKNLPDIRIAPKNHFNTVLYSGTGGTQSITGVGFQPDLIWKKARNETRNHYLTDAVRGVQKSVSSNNADVEDSSTSYVTAFGTDGWSMGATSAFNKNAITYAAWNWKAGSGNTAVSESGNNPGGTHNANVAAGFSIVKYVGTGAAGTVTHGLGAKPGLILIKNLDVNDSWAAYYGDPTDYLRLNNSSGSADDATFWNDAAPTTSVFTVNTNHSVNADGENYIAYCYTTISGYSKIGIYKGNGNADGEHVYCGFRPAFLLVKKYGNGSNGSGWVINDSKRLGYNNGNPRLRANTTGGEDDAGRIDLTATGFKMRVTYQESNENNVPFLFYAVSDIPLKVANAR